MDTKSIFHQINRRAYQQNEVHLINETKDNLAFVQRLGLLERLAVHEGCVNTLSWNSTGRYILSGSDDQNLVITNAFSGDVLHRYRTSHTANIFSAKFLPCHNDQQIISCSGDGILLHTDLTKPKESSSNRFNCHDGTVYEVITIPNDPNTFISCGEDGTVRWFDLRHKSKCTNVSCRDDVMINCSQAVTALAINPMISQHLAIGCSDSTVRIYDRRYLSTQNVDKSKPFCIFVAPNLQERSYRITSLCYSNDGSDMLVSYSSEHLYLFTFKEQKTKELKKEPASHWSKLRQLRSKISLGDRRSSPPVRRLRLRGDWSDTGPDARPERDGSSNVNMISQARPQLHSNLMQRMTDVLSRMLNDPRTRAALSGGGEDSMDRQAESAPSAGEDDVEPAAVAAVPTMPISRLQADLNFARRIGYGGDRRPRQEVFTSAVPPPQPAPQPGEDYSLLSSAAELSTLRSVTEDEIPGDIVVGTAMDAQRNSSNTPASHQSSDSYQSSNVNTAIVTRHLRNRLSILRSLRQGYIEQHGAEPSVNLRYSDQSTSNSTISLSGNAFPVEVERQLGAQEENEGEHEQMQDVELDYEDTEDCYKAKSEAAVPYGEIDSDGYYTLFESQMKKKYVGHRNARTMIKEATFWGNDFVMSGSDCGHVFVWNKHTGQLQMLLEADHHVVNCLQPHPTLPYLATSGIDHDIKIWAPIMDGDVFDPYRAQGLMKRNEIMLEETRDTITVPAAFMIRMLACLNQMRHGRRTRREDGPTN